MIQNSEHETLVEIVKQDLARMRPSSADMELSAELGDQTENQECATNKRYVLRDKGVKGKVIGGLAAAALVYCAGLSLVAMFNRHASLMTRVTALENFEYTSERNNTKLNEKIGFLNSKLDTIDITKRPLLCQRFGSVIDAPYNPNEEIMVQAQGPYFVCKYATFDRDGVPQ